jgi:peptide/nickel transport system permease protein
MFRYLIRRILWAILLFIVITFVTFVIFFMGPNDPARAQCGGDQAQPACLKLVTEHYGLDKPLYIQYWRFFKRLVFHQSLGHSYATGQNINQAIGKAAPRSCSAARSSGCSSRSRSACTRR